MSKLITLLSLFVLITGCVATENTELKVDTRGQETNHELFIPASGDYAYELQIADRTYVESVLKDVFSITANSAEATYLQTNIYQKIEFGGPCDPYSSSDLAANVIEFSREACTNGIAPVQASTNNAMRYSLTTKACEYLIGRSNMMDNVKKKIYSSGKWGTPSDESFRRAWGLFYPVTTPNEEIVKSFLQLGKVLGNDEEAWKGIMLTLCMSPEWQSF